MTSFRPRIWLGLSLSVLGALPARAADTACAVPVLGPSGEAGEAGGEGATTTPETRALVLDRMAAQIAAAGAAQAAGDAEAAAILVAAATDEGPARLARRGQRAEAALEAALAPFAVTPTDATARASAERAIDAVLAGLPEAAPPPSRITRAAALVALSLDAFSDSQDCGKLVDRAAYEEARALLHRAHALVAGLQLATAVDMARDLGRLERLLPAAPPALLPAGGDMAALVSRVLLAASDVAP